MPRSQALQNFRIQAGQGPGTPTIDQLAGLILRGSLEGQRASRPESVRTSPSGLVLPAEEKTQKTTKATPASTFPVSRTQGPKPTAKPKANYRATPPKGIPKDADLQADLKFRESSGNQYAVNSATGALGWYQFMPDTLKQLGFINQKGEWTGKAGVKSAEEFLASEKAQDEAWKAHVPEMKRQLKANGAWKYIGKEVPGYGTVTEKGLLRAAHLGGAGGANKFLKNGTNPADANATKISDYMFAD